MLAACGIAFSAAAAAQGLPAATGPSLIGRTAVAEGFPAWRQFRAGPAHTGAGRAETILGLGTAGQIMVRWQAQAGSAALGNGVFGPPSVLNGVVHVNSHEGKLYAFAAESGAQVAALPVEGPIESGPAIVDGRVYVGTLAGKVYAFGLP